MVDVRNVFVLMYIVIGYTIGIILILSNKDLLILSVSTVLLTHTLVWSDYMHHELCHNLVFDNVKWNIRFGYIMDWLNGASYWTFEELKKQHLNHHIFKVDYDVTSGLLKWLHANRISKYSLLLCEYFYFPLHAYILQWRAVSAPWWNEQRKFARFRTAIICAIRTIYFSLLFYTGGPTVLFCYLIASSISIQITRFTDAFSHSYEVVPVGTRRKYLTKSYDMLHTYTIAWETDETTPIIVRLCAEAVHVIFFLNFNFHNHHHFATQTKWYQLGAPFRFDNELIMANRKCIDTKLNDDDGDEEEYVMNHQPDKVESTACGNSKDSLCGVPKRHFTIPLLVALRVFHTHRVDRIFKKSNSPALDPASKQPSLENCYGVTDAPMLILEI